MRSIIILVLLASCFVLSTSLVLNLFDPSKLKVILGAARKFCPENTTNAENYESIVRTTVYCYIKVSLQNESMCHNLQNNIPRCSQPLVDYIVGCLPEKSKDIPPAFLISVRAIVRNFCSNPAEFLLEDFNPCISESFDQNVSSKRQCRVDTLGLKFAKFKEEYPSKLEFCQLARESLDCWQEAVKIGCKNEITKKFFLQFSKGLYSGCE